jgi:2-aminophenol/2-amino-5-chlorophenol 1,6-dioxygenase alpha subunit
MQGLHVDENWYEWQDIPYHIRTDVGFSEDCIQSTGAIGVRSRPVDYDGFPVDTGTLVAQHFLNPDAALPIVATSNNLYHDWDRTQQLGGVVRSVAARRGQRVAVVAVGGLSARMFRAPIDPATDHIATNEDDAANRALLATLEQGDSAALRQSAAAMAGAGPTDMGLKHLAFLVGATGAAFNGAVVHGYEPIYGTGAAVVELRL